MKWKYGLIVGVASVVVVLSSIFAVTALSQTATPPPQDGMIGPDMMIGPGVPSGPGTGPGGIAGPDAPGSMMAPTGGHGPGDPQGSDSQQSPGGGSGPGYGWGMGQGMGSGMMGPWWNQQNSDARPISADQAADAVNRYLAQTGYPGLVLDEVMEFQYNYYADVKEKDTGAFAFELLVDKFSGNIYPEMGPNMMWNTKYGMMGDWMMGRSVWNQDEQPTTDMQVTAEGATALANAYLARTTDGTTVETPDAYYGYYAFHTMQDGKVTGMLSVNGYNGEVFYHWWHGQFVDMKEMGS